MQKKQIFKPTLKTAKKVCEFEGCGEEFQGVSNGGNKGKYCLEHRKQKYRKIIDKDKIKKKKEIKQLNNNNQIIKHSYRHPVVVKAKCQLEGCNKDFELMIIPITYTYPCYCPLHRNEYKRQRFLNNG